MVHGEPDYTVRARSETDEVYIKGVGFISPTIAGCKPVSIENPALAYNAPADRFKVDIEAMSVGAISVDVSDRAARLLGIIYGDQGQLLQRPTTKDLLVQLRHGGAEIDPRNRNWTITENLKRAWTLSDVDVPDLRDRAARLVGVVYGSQGQKLAQAAGSPYPLETVPRASAGVYLKQKTTTGELLINPVYEAHGSDVELGGVSSPAAAGEVLIDDYTPASGKVINITEVIGGGSINGYVTVYWDTNVIWRGRFLANLSCGEQFKKPLKKTGDGAKKLELKVYASGAGDIEAFLNAVEV